MKRILLVTLWGDTNLGNKLQNYALQTILENKGFEVHTAICNPKLPLFIQFKMMLKNLLSLIGIRKYANMNLNKLREKRLKDFSDEYVKHPVYFSSFSDSYKLQTSSYSYAVTGSDQVWHNWFGKQEELEYYYLDFFPESKRVSFPVEKRML